MHIRVNESKRFFPSKIFFFCSFYQFVCVLLSCWPLNEVKYQILGYSFATSILTGWPVENKYNFFVKEYRMCHGNRISPMRTGHKYQNGKSNWKNISIVLIVDHSTKPNSCVCVLFIENS